MTMLLMRLTDIRVAALVAAVLGLAGIAGALALLTAVPKVPAAAPVALLRVAPAETPVEVGEAVASPPAGTFAVAARTEDRLDGVGGMARVGLAFAAFDAAKPSEPMPAPSVVALRPGLMPDRSAGVAIAAIEAAVPLAPADGGTGGPLQYAALDLPGPPPARPSLRSALPPLLAPIAAEEGPPVTMPKGAAPYLDLIRREARANGVPLWLALGVIWVESKYDPNLRGARTVLGLMQIKPSTARYLGFKGTDEELLTPEVNVAWGMKELAKGLRHAKGDVCLTAAKYKGGFMTPRVNAGAQRYCDLMRKVTGMDGVTEIPVPAGPPPVVATRTANR